MESRKLIGSPPGYLGHRKTHPLLSQEAINQYQTVAVRLSLILFDQIEKASDPLWNLLLGILDKGTLTLGDNRKVDFSLDDSLNRIIACGNWLLSLDAFRTFLANGSRMGFSAAFSSLPFPYLNRFFECDLSGCAERQPF